MGTSLANSALVYPRHVYAGHNSVAGREPGVPTLNHINGFPNQGIGVLALLVVLGDEQSDVAATPSEPFTFTWEMAR